MSGITVTATATPITASASGGQVNVSVGSTQVASVLSPSQGPQGPAGPQGPPGASVGALDDLTDVLAATPSTGDVLRYSAGSWRNFPEVDLTLEGGNW